MLVQNPNMPKMMKEIKFETLEAYLNYINKSTSWNLDGFEWYCKFSPIVFYIDDGGEYCKIDGPHIIELCNILLENKCDKGANIIFKSTEANWNLKISTTNFYRIKNMLVNWNEMIEAKINSQGLNDIAVKSYYRRNRAKRIDKINLILGIITVLFILSIAIYYIL